MTPHAALVGRMRIAALASVWLFLLRLTQVAASPLECNPVMLANVPLGDTHPAFGAIMSNATIKADVTLVIKTDPNQKIAAMLPIVNHTALELVTIDTIMPTFNPAMQYLNDLLVPLDDPIVDANAAVQSADLSAISTKNINIDLNLARQSRSRLRTLEAATTDVGKLEEFFSESMERNFDVLQSKYASGAAKKLPWPSSYWPVYQDSINVQWKSGEPSAAEKYALAFGKDPTLFMNTISSANGIDHYRGNTPCANDWECSNQGTKCAKRTGQQRGYCIPTWYGICHAWAPAAVLEPEPRCDVTKNNVTFHAYDLKGLLSMVYDAAGVDVVFTGARFDGPDSPAIKDRYGRYESAARRDLGPGFFHIAIANLLGRRQQSFVVDISAGAEVWNQPVRSYQVLESSLVDLQTGSQQYFGTESYPFNAEAKRLAYVKTKFSWIIEGGSTASLANSDQFTSSATYEYFLELDAKSNILGGEWLSDSRYNHPDFLWFAKHKPAPAVVTPIGLSYSEISAMVTESAACGSSTTEPETEASSTTPVPTLSSSQRICGTAQSGVDFDGNDLSMKWVSSPSECCKLCQQNTECHAFTYYDYWATTQCYLKTSASGRKSAWWAMSVIMT